MTGGACYREFKEKGAWFELKSLVRVIELEEISGKDASFERCLYKNWLKIPEYKKADADNRRNAIYGVSPCVTLQRESVTNGKHKEKHQRHVVPHKTVTPIIDAVTAKCRELAAEGKSTRKIALILQAAGFPISHMTVARKLQEGLL